jgi:hypothetical protein
MAINRRRIASACVNTDLGNTDCAVGFPIPLLRK